VDIYTVPPPLPVVPPIPEHTGQDTSALLASILCSTPHGITARSMQVDFAFDADAA
jgi:hypothetical protein